MLDCGLPATELQHLMDMMPLLDWSSFPNSDRVREDKIIELLGDGEVVQTTLRRRHGSKGS